MYIIGFTTIIIGFTNICILYFGPQAPAIYLGTIWSFKTTTRRSYKIKAYNLLWLMKKELL